MHNYRFIADEAHAVVVDAILASQPEHERDRDAVVIALADFGIMRAGIREDIEADEERDQQIEASRAALKRGS